MPYLDSNQTKTAMKNLFILIFLCTTYVCYSQTNSIDSTSRTARRFIDPSDPLEQPNVDPNWDWTQCCSGHTMYYSLNGSTPTRLDNVQVPFYTNGHPLADAANNDLKDMWQQDGWMLVYKDFGTSVTAPPYPFFALYNKYKGTLRVMIYNSASLLNTYFKVTLSFRSSSPKSAIFAFAENRYNLQYLNSYDANATQVAITKVNQGQGWIHGDFILTGYVPDLNTSTVLHLDVKALNETQLTAEGSLTLDEVLASSPGGNDFNGNFVEGVNKGYKAYKDVNTAAKDLGKSSSGIGSVFGLFSAFTEVVKFVEFLISGKSESSGREPLSFKGSTKINGTLTTAFQVLEYDFAMFGSMPNLPDYYRPLQSIPWGVVNVVNALQPSCQTTEYGPYECEFSPGNMVYDYNTRCYGPSIDYVSNHASLGMQLISVQAMPIFYSGADNNLGFENVSTVPQNANYGYSNSNGCYGNLGERMATSIGIKFEYEILSPTKNYDQKLILYKQYHFQDNSGNRLAVYEAKSDEKENIHLFPNPFKEKVRIVFNAPKESIVEVNLFDIRGNKVQSYQVDKPFASGVRHFEWDGKSSSGVQLPSGLYIAEIKVDNLRKYTKRIVKQ